MDELNVIGTIPPDFRAAVAVGSIKKVTYR